VPCGQLASTGYQEPWQLLQIQVIQPCWQQEFWCLFASCWLPGTTVAAQSWGTKPVGSRSSGACFLVHASGSSVQQLLPKWGKQAHWLVPSVTHEATGALGPTYIGHWFLWRFRVKVAGHVVGGSMELWVPVYARKQDLPPSQHWIIEPGAVQRLQGRGIGSVELRVILPILSVVSCFSICGFRENFVSHWLWDPVGTFGVPWSSFFRVVSHH
jgi:hypothetical protein